MQSLNYSTFFVLMIFLTELPYLSHAQQPVKMAVVERESYFNNQGDTIPIFGLRFNDNGEIRHAIVDSPTGRTRMSINRLALLDTIPTNYWEEIWWRHRSESVGMNGWNSNEREILNEDAMEYFSNAQQNNLIFDDDLLYDYLYQILHLIHPDNLIRPEKSRFSILVIKSNVPESFAFNNGLLVLTTASIAKCLTDGDLINLLTGLVCHVVLEHNLENLKQELRAEQRAQFWGNFAAAVSAAAQIYGEIKYDIPFNPNLTVDAGMAAYFVSSSVLESIGAKYSMEQHRLSDKISRKFLANGLPNRFQTPRHLENIASSISFTATQYFSQKNYLQAEELMEFLLENGLATEDEYLLLARIQRTTKNTPASNRLALDYLSKAETLGEHTLVEIYKEMGLIHLRLGNYHLASEAFNNYKNGLERMPDQGRAIQNELIWVNKLLQRQRLMDSQSHESP